MSSQDLDFKTRCSDRYQFEHSVLPDFILGSDGADIIRIILHNKGAFFVNGYKFIHKDEENYTCPYETSDFKFIPVKLDDEKYCLRINLPEPEVSPLCRSIFITHNKNFGNRRYFTLETGTKPGEEFLCEWDKDKKHINYGNKPGDPFMRILTILFQG